MDVLVRHAPNGLVRRTDSLQDDGAHRGPTAPVPGDLAKDRAVAASGPRLRWGNRLALVRPLAMATQKTTFSLDTLTAARITALSRDLGKSKSEIVQEAVSLYARYADRLSEDERLERVRTFKELVARIPPRSREEVEAELAALRHSRRAALRRHSRTEALPPVFPVGRPARILPSAVSAAGTSSGTSLPPCSAGPPRSRCAPCRPGREAVAPPSGRGRSRPRARR